MDNGMSIDPEMRRQVGQYFSTALEEEEDKSWCAQALSHAYPKNYSKQLVKATAKRRKANKVARKARKINRK